MWEPTGRWLYVGGALPSLSLCYQERPSGKGMGARWEGTMCGRGFTLPCSLQLRLRGRWIDLEKITGSNFCTVLVNEWFSRYHIITIDLKARGLNLQQWDIFWWNLIKSRVGREKTEQRPERLRAIHRRKLCTTVYFLHTHSWYLM